MNKIFFLLIILTSAPLLRSEEPHFYLQGSAGYSFGFPAQYIGQEADNSGSAVYEGLAQGFGLEAGVGYAITGNLGVEVGFWYLAGSAGTPVGQGSVYSVDLPAVMPSVVLDVQVGNRIELYTKFGLCLALPTIKMQDKLTAEEIIRGNGEGALYFTGGSATGLRGVVGMGIGDASTVLFLEVSFVDMSWGPERLVNNRGVTVVQYQERFAYPTGGPPYTEIQPRFNLGTISGRVGVRIVL